MASGFCMALGAVVLQISAGLCDLATWLLGGCTGGLPNLADGGLLAIQMCSGAAGNLRDASRRATCASQMVEAGALNSGRLTGHYAAEREVGWWVDACVRRSVWIGGVVSGWGRPDGARGYGAAPMASRIEHNIHYAQSWLGRIRAFVSSTRQWLSLWLGSCLPERSPDKDELAA